MRGFFWRDPVASARHLIDIDDQRIAVCKPIDNSGFNWKVWAVASSGFFTDSYNLFATNVILPSLAYVYWTKDPSSHHETAINVVTLAGSLLGQLLFGFLADKLGRKKLYGIELIVVIVGTLGVAQSSRGYDGSMAITGWILFYRLVVGIGIGAEYPLSAVITAEFAPVQSRARMLAAVFLMQPIGQLMAQLVGLFVLLGIGRTKGLSRMNDPEDHEAAAAIVDRIWRCVIGVGAFPALVAIVFRLSIPESPRFTLDVQKNPGQAIADAEEYYHSQDSLAIRDARSVPVDGNPVVLSMLARHESHYIGGEVLGHPQGHDGPYPPDRGPEPDDLQRIGLGDGTDRDLTSDSHSRNGDVGIGDNENLDNNFAERPSRSVRSLVAKAPGSARVTAFSFEDIHQYFWLEGNWRHLAGTASTWFLLDFAFYGLGINNPSTVAKIWFPSPVNWDAKTPQWQNDAPTAGANIYDILLADAKEAIITISIGSLVGSLIVIKVINYIPRKTILAWSFVVLAILLAITGSTFFKAFETDLHALTIVFYVLCQLAFNLGPNTLTFIIPAEIFPTRYRCTCYGISAAAGKLGSIIAQVILPHIRLRGKNVNDPNSNGLGLVLLVFAILMGFGSLFAWALLPEVQDLQRARGMELPNKTLEELAEGRRGQSDQENANWIRHVQQGLWSKLMGR